VTVTDPVDGGFELDGVLFGERGDVLVESFSPGSADKRTQDTDAPMGSYRQFGRDFKTPPTWGWSLSTNRNDETGTHDTLEALAAVWDRESDEEPNGVTALRYRINGRTRRVYGRPGRFVYTPDVRRKQGYMAIDCDFRLADTRHYEDAEQVATLSMEPSHPGGLVSPLLSPLTSLDATDDQDGQIVVGGTMPTPLVVEITGQATRPYIEIVGLMSLRLEGNVDTGDTVTLDARPWALSATRLNGGSVAGMLLGNRVSELMIPPGSYQLRFGASASTGGASATVRWRAASKTL
jgi:hypothetical protein